MAATVKVAGGGPSVHACAVFLHADVEGLGSRGIPPSEKCEDRSRTEISPLTYLHVDHAQREDMQDGKGRSSLHWHFGRPGMYLFGFSKE